MRLLVCAPKPLALILLALILGAGAEVNPVRADDSLCPAPLRIGWFDSRPYHFKGDDGAVTGLDVEILSAVLDHAGCLYEYKEIPLKRSLSGLEFGVLDMVMGASLSAERETYALFSQPYRRELMVMFMRKGEETGFTPTRLADIVAADLVVGVHIGSWYGAEYAYLFGNDPAFRAQVLQASDYPALFRGLMRGRVDIVLDDLFSGLDILKRQNTLAAAAVHLRPVNDDVTHFMYSKQAVSQALVDRIDALLLAYEKSDAFMAVSRKYIPDNFLHYLPVQQAGPAVPPKIGSDITPPTQSGR